MANFWNKRVLHNAIISLVLFFTASCLVSNGAFSSFQASFNNLLLGSPANSNTGLTVVNMAFETFFMVVLINLVPAALSIIIPLGMMVLSFLAAKTLSPFGIEMDFFYTYFLGFALFVSNVGYNLIFFDKDRKRIREMFEHYLAPEYITQVAKDPKKLTLGGEEREMTILFSDIRSFSTISEKLSPEKLVLLLNRFLTPMTNIIMQNRGIVDKYIGDAIMAFWGAPLDDPNHAKNGVKSALEMLRELEKLNKTLDQPLRIGIGINSEKVVVGNMGSEKRFNYTVMGDGVNLASRLEGLNKYYGAPIIISENTRSQMESEFSTRLLDIVAVKGKTKGVKIYEVLGDKGASGELVNATQRALDAYFDRQWKTGKSLFEALEKIDSNKIYAQVFIERCNEFIKKEPRPDWNLVWEMHEK